MRTWNNRVWECSNEAGVWYEVRKTYYNDAGEICACKESASTAHGETIDDLKEYLEMLQVAVENAQAGVEILDDEGFEFTKWDGDSNESEEEE